MKLHLKDKVLIVVMLALTIGGCVAFARPVSFGWTDTNPPEMEAGFVFYTNGVPALTYRGSQTNSCTLDLPAGTIVCSVTALGIDGTESDFSNSVTNMLLARPSRLHRN